MKVEFFTDTNMTNLEKAINSFFQNSEPGNIYSIQHSQSSYVIPAEDPMQDIALATTIITVAVYYIDDKPPDRLPA
jgi:hypothetical protein